MEVYKEVGLKTSDKSIKAHNSVLCQINKSKSFKVIKRFPFIRTFLGCFDDIDKLLKQNALDLDNGELGFEHFVIVDHIVSILWLLEIFYEFFEVIQYEEDSTNRNAPL